MVNAWQIEIHWRQHSTHVYSTSFNRPPRSIPNPSHTHTRIVHHPRSRPAYLHAEADAEVGHLVLTRILRREDLSLHPPVAEPAGHEDAIDITWTRGRGGERERGREEERKRGIEGERERQKI